VAASEGAGLKPLWSDRGPEREQASGALKTSKKMVYKLAALFSLDSFAGGLILDSMLVLWPYDKFQLSTAVAGTIFFWTGVLSAFSYLIAVRIARRIGLVNTMVMLLYTCRNVRPPGEV
jgi:hypothetical protein